ncbi:histone lysine methyltransferase set7 [Lichtheimia corymbifera JMRC:FSU:9682]|uniref:Histone lysine methyltransferase set7 n=1 Tax=Lichtheimia corymbifera JMRC:FSU:9682 TaxID=1263082 RepID=A0A068SEH0_9FUNG|nr:histone lysine methyltransferase set7 [Lichtheimia corymbifera JMRC:FSU:9682]
MGQPPDLVPLEQHQLDLELRSHPLRGRGVFTKARIPRNTLVEISPVLLFRKDEYKQHGQYTILDHYTYVWKDGQFALALGLGSMFNHDKNPNVGYFRDLDNNLIRYVTSRDIEPEEELCIFYGSNLWFEDTNDDDRVSIPNEDDILATGFMLD